MHGLRVRAGRAAGVLLLAASVGVAAGLPAVGDEADGTGSSLSVEIPYGGSETREVPDGWVVRACPEGALPNLVALRCDGGRVTFAGLGYSPDVAPQDVTIATTFRGAPQRLTYRVALRPPGLRPPEGGLYGYPLGQGVRVTIPFSELVAGCEACEETGPTYVGANVQPADAGSAAFSGLGLVFRPAPGFVGQARVTFRVRDRFGQESERTSVDLRVVEGTSHAPTIVADTVAVDAGQRAYGNALGNDARLEGYASRVASCGQPVNGTVTCDPDGGYVYTPNEGFTGVDQFSYHVVTTPGNDQAVGSVVVGVGADPVPPTEVPEQSEATSLMTPPRPLSARERARNAGVLSLLRDTLAAIHDPGPA